MSVTPSALRDSRVPWMGQIPAGWSTRPLWSMFRRVKDIDHPQEQMLSVFRDHGVVAKASRANINRTAENRSIYQLVFPGWLVTNRMKAWQGSVGITPLRGIVSGHYICFAPTHDQDSRYLNWLFRSSAYSDGYALISRGVRIGQAEIDNDLYRTMPVLLPPLPKQRAIADFLDRETAQIDTLIAKQEQLITTLRERHAALVSHAFEARERVSRIQRACLDVVDCVHTTPEPDAEGECEAVRTGSVRGGRYRPEFSIQVSRSTWRERNGASAPRPGDVLFTREAPAGEACIVPTDRDVCLGQRMVLLRINPAVAMGEFLVWQIYSQVVQDYFQLSTSGSTVGNLRLGVIRATPLWLPDLSTQRSIALQLGGEAAKMDRLIGETRRFIDLAKERRSALITAAVTGQLDIQGAA